MSEPTPQAPEVSPFAATPTGLPYPLDSDAVMLGAQAIKALAEALDRRFRIVSVSVDIPSTAAHSSITSTIQVAIPGLAVGDYCAWIGHSSVGATFHFWCQPPVCSVAGQIPFRGFNADTAIADPNPDTHYFLVIAHA
jgi:hypothetical protein